MRKTIVLLSIFLWWGNLLGRIEAPREVRIVQDVESGTATMSWRRVDDVALAGYYVFRSNQSGNYGLPLDAKKDTFYVFKDLIWGRRYFCSVLAYDRNENTSKFSDEVSFTFGDASEARSLKVWVSWDPVSDADLKGYRIHCAPRQTMLFSVTDIALRDANRWLLSGLDYGTDYALFMTSYDSAYNESERSEEIHFRFDYEEERHELITPRVACEYVLYQNYPNPFNQWTTIRFDLPHSGWLKLEIFNVTGRRVRRIYDDFFEGGIYMVNWDGKDDSNKDLCSGIYFCRLVMESYSAIKKMVRIFHRKMILVE